MFTQMFIQGLIAAVLSFASSETANPKASLSVTELNLPEFKDATGKVVVPAKKSIISQRHYKGIGFSMQTVFKQDNTVESVSYHATFGLASFWSFEIVKGFE